VLFLHPEPHDGCSRGQATFWSHCPCEGREKGLHTGESREVVGASGHQANLARSIYGGVPITGDGDKNRLISAIGR
jgi:hypothetical protein